METKQKDKRKLLLVLPLMVLPFLALAFYAAGGGNSSNDETTTPRGINVNLPDASFKNDEPGDKLGFYQLAAKDSTGNPCNGIEEVAGRLGFITGDNNSSENQINQKLAELDREINRPMTNNQYSQSTASSRQSSTMNHDIDRMEALMRAMQNNGEDPELNQLNGMLENILDIQHPQRIQERYSQKLAMNPDSQFRAIPAIIVENQKAVQGATVKLKLQDTVLLNGYKIPKGHYLFGTCRITNQRLLLNITSIRLGSSIIPVDLTVYSLDGMAGIEAPEAMLTDAVNNGAGDAVRNLQFMGFDQSTEAQIAGAGINAAKSLFNKKVKTVKVKLKANYRVLLRNNQQRAPR